MSLSTTQLSHEQAARFLSRATFGVKGNDINDLVNLNITDWFTAQFAYPVKSHLTKMREFADATGDAYNENPRMSAWWYFTMNSQDTLRQRLAFALSQIVVVSKNGGPNSEGLAEYYDLLLTHAFGNFKDLLKAVTLSPAMGKFLTLSGSRKANPTKNTFPDENYAREVMQLFSLGLWQLTDDGIIATDGNGDRIPNYTQTDIEELARVLTGWKIQDYHQSMYADEKQHDTDEKQVLGHTFPAGQTAAQDVDQAVEVLFQHSNTPVYIATLLIKRLTISNPRREYIQRVANTFKDNGVGVRGDMQAIIKAILLDDDLLAGVAMQDHQQLGSSQRNFGKIKEPLIAMANLARALNIQSNHPARWYDWIGTRNNFGQAPLCAPSVFNFYDPDYAPNGEITDVELVAPEFAILNTDIMRRINNAMWNSILSYRNTKETQWTWDESEFINNIDDVDAYLNVVNQRLFSGLMSATTAAEITRIFLSYSASKTKNRLHDTLFVAQCSPEFRCQE
ncbi:DUF1800 domain-containing protein [Moritella sp. 24]|uniref:DUF1800 domain-containing protein n=1 Tax=Moritella sp. 24 TaxID=2746230 RepID=UPI001BA55099|nr:DUF1800 domain-containing protein [Moritella sp. 24]QUM75946.1 DUF1800 domain-containing protein [Moritella sp. 24]